MRPMLSGDTARKGGAAVKLALLLALSLAVGLAAPAFAADPAGDWHGVIAPTPAIKLRILLHVEKAADGGYAGTLTSVDQGTPPIPLTTLTSTGDDLSFTIAQISGAFSGKWDEGQKAWVGQWTQAGRSFPLTLASGRLPPSAVVGGLDGRWEGLLATERGRLNLVLRVHTDAQGTSAAIDSPDQAVLGLTVDHLRRDGANVTFDLTALGASYAGKLSADGASLSGVWSQGGLTHPLDFKRTSASAALSAPERPQTPKKPYPYREEDLAFFAGGAAQVRLAGTLTLPPGAGPFPAVVLVAGSGPNTRNEAVFGHQPFLVLADYLTRHGVAVLRYDKRGTGASSGDYPSATTKDFADDALAAETYLRGRKEIDGARVGLIGHSEGGLIVPMVATRDPKIAFIVLMAGPGVDGLDVLLEQGRLILKASGASDAWVDQTDALRQKLLGIVRSEKDQSTAAAKMKAALDDFAKAHNLPASALEGGGDQLARNADWWRFFLSYDPAATLAQVQCPVLALIGSKDLQVPADQNLPALRAALARNPGAEVLELPDLNHLFQTAKTGGVGEYMQIPETIAPSALATISDWIQRRVHEPPTRSTS
jgi:pimeloyl-ACP methyl ester carboxylesterase